MMNMALTYSSPYLSNLSAVHLSQIVQTCGETAIFTKVLITVACFSKNSVHAKHVGRIWPLKYLEVTVIVRVIWRTIFEQYLEGRVVYHWLTW